MLRKLKLFITSADHYTGHCLARMVATVRDRFQEIIVGGTDQEKLKDLDRQGLKVVHYNVENKSDLEKHFRNIDVVFLLPPHRNENMDKAGRNMIEACKSAGVHCVLLWSMLAADQGQKMIKQLGELEKELEKSGIPSYAIMRVSLYMEFFLFYARQVQQKGELPLPTGEGKFAPISIRDVCRFAVVLLSGKRKGGDDDRDDDDDDDRDDDDDDRDESRKFDARHIFKGKWTEDAETTTGPFRLPDRHHKKKYCLTGEKSVTGREIVQRASKALGADIKFRNIERNEAERILKESQQLHQNEIELVLEAYEMIKQNKWDITTDDYKKVVGTKPKELERFFSDHQNEFKPRK